MRGTSESLKKTANDAESEKYFCPYFVDVAGNSDFARRVGRFDAEIADDG